MSTTQQGLTRPGDSALAYGDQTADISAPITWQTIMPACGLLLLLAIVRLKLLFTPLPLYDFMTYWSAGRLFLSHADPYSIAAVFAVERSIGWPYSQPLVMVIPPWSLPFAALLGALPFHVARYGWLAASLALEVVSSLALWRYFGGKKEKQWIALVILATFLPTGTAEHMGQVTPLILASLTLFLYLLRSERYVLAGICLLVVGFKPHLSYLVIAAVLLWALKNKRRSLVASAASAYAAVIIGAIAFNHNILGYLRNGSVGTALDMSNGVGGVLRAIFGRDHIWLQFLPTVVGTAWFAYYWVKNRSHWIWEVNLPTVLLASIATAPYFWAHDFILAIPAFIALAVALSRTRTDWLIPAALFLLTQLAIGESGLLSKAWMAAASLLWLVLYHLGMHSLSPRTRRPGASAYFDRLKQRRLTRA